MTQKEYNLRRKRYGIKYGLQNPGRRMYQYAAKRERDLLSGRERRPSDSGEEYLPYGLFFRVRVILCIGLFLLFAYADKNVFNETDKRQVYQAIEQDTSPLEWKNYAKNVYSYIKNAADRE